MTMTQITAGSSSIKIFSEERANVSLPNEVLLQLFLELAPWDLGQSSLVSKQWLQVSDDLKIWKLFAEKIYPELPASKLLKEKQKLCSDQFLDLKKEIIQHYRKKLKDSCFLEQFRARHIQFKEPVLQVFYSYAKSHREKVILYPEYLMSIKSFSPHYSSLGIYKRDIFNLFIDLNEEELIFHFHHHINLIDPRDYNPDTPHLNNKHVLSGDIFKLNLEDKLKSFPILHIFKRLLDKGSFSLIAAKLYKCHLYFAIKYGIISTLLHRIEGLPWFRRSLILSTLKSNLKMDNSFSLSEREKLSDMLNTVEQKPLVIQTTIASPKNESFGLYKTAHFALAFFKRGCLFVGGLSACALLRGWVISPYLVPLSLKIFILAGLCFAGIKVLEKVLETSSDDNINALIDQTLELVDSSQDYKAWKQKITDQGILNSFVYKACHTAQVPYRRIDGLQTEREAYEVFYAIHFAIDQFATTQETRFSVKTRTKLFKLIEFLEQWRTEILGEIFVKRDLLYQNPSFFNKQKYREALATLRTKEALEIYEIKKRARKINLEFTETIQIKEYKEKIEAMAAATKECSNLEEWIALLEKTNLLSELLKLAQYNLPPSYRCVSSGKLLFAAVSQQGNFYDTQVFEELRKNDLPFEHEFEVSWQLFSAISQVFKNHFNLSGSTNREIIDCIEFLVEHGCKKHHKISCLKLSKLKLSTSNSENETNLSEKELNALKKEFRYELNKNFEEAAFLRGRVRYMNSLYSTSNFFGLIQKDEYSKYSYEDQIEFSVKSFPEHL